MTLDAFFNAIITAVGAAGGVGVVVLVFGRWLVRQWETRLERRWTEGLQREIEGLRADLNLSEAVLTQVAASSSAGFHAAQDRRIIAIAKLWAEVMSLKCHCASTLYPYSILVREEIETLKPDDEILVGVPRSWPKFSREMLEGPEDIELQRPFLGERLWGSFWIYRAVMLRVVWRVAKGLEDGRIPWWDVAPDGSDDAVVGLLQEVLSPEEIAKARSTRMGGLDQILELLQQRVLAEMEAWMSGRHASQASLQQARETAAMLGRTTALFCADVSDGS